MSSTKSIPPCWFALVIDNSTREIMIVAVDRNQYECRLRAEDHCKSGQDLRVFNLTGDIGKMRAELLSWFEAHGMSDRDARATSVVDLATAVVGVADSLLEMFE